jgi:hypothetical protein
MGGARSAVASASKFPASVHRRVLEPTARALWVTTRHLALLHKFQFNQLAANLSGSSAVLRACTCYVLEPFPFVRRQLHFVVQWPPVIHCAPTMMLSGVITFRGRCATWAALEGSTCFLRRAVGGEFVV